MEIEYEELGLVLARHGILNISAEVHGMVCGQIACGALPFSAQLTGKVLALDSVPAELVDLFNSLASEIQLKLEGDDFGFSPLLPDDDEDLGLRIHALGRWCDGFNLGFAAGYSSKGQAILEETKEVLADFARIAEVQDDDYDDSQEADYMEVVEYLRVATASVFLQHNLKEESGVSEPEPDDNPVQLH